MTTTASFAAPLRAPKIGDFNPPTLSGWKQKTLVIDALSKVSYRKEVQQNRLLISFSHLKVLDNATQHVRRLQSQIKPNTIYTSRPKRYGGKIQVTKVRKATSFNGLPAVLTQELYQGQDGKGRLFSAKHRILNFAKGKQSYLLEANISSRTATISPQALTELERTWKRVTAQVGTQAKP